MPPDNYWPPGQNPNQEVALSVNKSGTVYWGASWSASGNIKSFTPFNKDNLKATTNVYAGNGIPTRAIWGASIAKVTAGGYVQATGDSLTYEGTLFKIEAVGEGVPWSDRNTWQREDPNRSNIDP
jgi:hypothetical protein